MFKLFNIFKKEHITKHDEFISSSIDFNKSDVVHSFSNISRRCRNWSFIVYPDAVSPYWLDSVSSLGFPLICSPLHVNNRDRDGNYKMPHYHCIIFLPYPVNHSYISHQLSEIGIPSNLVSVCTSVKSSLTYMLDSDGELANNDYDVLSFYNCDAADIFS